MALTAPDYWPQFFFESNSKVALQAVPTPAPTLLVLWSTVSIPTPSVLNAGTFWPHDRSLWGPSDRCWVSLASLAREPHGAPCNPDIHIPLLVNNLCCQGHTKACFPALMAAFIGLLLAEDSMSSKQQLLLPRHLQKCSHLKTEVPALSFRTARAWKIELRSHFV